MKLLLYLFFSHHKYSGSIGISLSLASSPVNIRVCRWLSASDTTIILTTSMWAFGSQQIIYTIRFQVGNEKKTSEYTQTYI